MRPCFFRACRNQDAMPATERTTTVLIQTICSNVREHSAIVFITAIFVTAGPRWSPLPYENPNPSRAAVLHGCGCTAFTLQAMCLHNLELSSVPSACLHRIAPSARICDFGCTHSCRNAHFAARSAWEGVHIYKQEATGAREPAIVLF